MFSRIKLKLDLAVKQIKCILKKEDLHIYSGLLRLVTWYERFIKHFIYRIIQSLKRLYAHCAPFSMAGGSIGHHREFGGKHSATLQFLVHKYTLVQC